MDMVLDVRGVAGKAARIREIRAMAGRAMLDGPHDYAVQELEGPLLDLAVAKAVGLAAVIHKVDNAIAPFFECCVLNECGRLQYQFLPSRHWGQGGQLAEDRQIGYEFHDVNLWVATAPTEDGAMRIPFGHGSTPLLAMMRALVTRALGDSVRM